ncbi:MAG: hypothetical protein Q9174_004736, partial [Haloplaca sp. 1 TL-2023]
DLVLKVQEIETLIEKLPGLGESVESQEGRIRRLEEEMRVVEARRVDAVRKREESLEAIEEVVERGHQMLGPLWGNASKSERAYDIEKA